MNGLEHLPAHILDDNVAEQQIEAVPGKDDRQPYEKYIVKEDFLELVRALIDPLN